MYFLTLAENTPITGIQQRTPRQPLHSVSTTPGKTPLPLKALQLANFQTPDSVGVSDGESSLDIEELEEVQDLLAEKDDELAGEVLSANTKPLLIILQSLNDSSKAYCNLLVLILMVKSLLS